MQNRHNIVTGAIVLAGVLAVTWAVSAPQRGRPNTALTKTDTAAKTIKGSAEWQALDAEIDSWDAGYGDATNKIAQVGDPKTREALSKVLACARDSEKAVKDLRRLMKTVVESEAQ
jgi:hypothetical protein